MSDHSDDDDEGKVIDCAHLFEEIRDNNIFKDAAKVETCLEDDGIVGKTARLAFENATLKLKNSMRVPVFLILAVWSAYAVYVNWAVLNWIDIAYSVSFTIVAFYMTIDAIWWQREFRHLRLALNEATAILAKYSSPSDL